MTVPSGSADAYNLVYNDAYDRAYRLRGRLIEQDDEIIVDGYDDGYIYERVVFVPEQSLLKEVIESAMT